MTWVYPAGEAVVTTRLGVAAAFFWVATVFLAGGAVDATARSLFAGGGIPWLALACLTVTWVTVLIAFRARDQGGALALIALLLAGGAVSWMLLTTLHTERLLAGPLPSFPLLAVCLSMALVGSMADPGSGALGTLLGYAAAQTGIALGFVQQGDAQPPWQPAALITALVVAAFHVLLGLIRRTARSVDRNLDSAGRADLEAAERRSLELQSRALLHDTVLSELAALGIARPGPLSARATQSIAESLAAARRASAGPVESATPAHALGELLERVRLAGLRVTVTGDPAAIDRVPDELRPTLLLALEQCLVNVLRHSGVDAAELSVTHSGDRLVATVVDEGSGFDESQVSADRFGFRESVRGRIEQLGGTVRVLSTPGLGASIVIAVPV